MAADSVSTATLSFGPGWREERHGDIVRRRLLSIEFDPARLPQCFANWRGAQFGDIEALVRFHPRGELVTGPLLAPIRSAAGLLTGHSPLPFQLQIPSDTTQIEMWFHNFFQTSSRCDAWDSRYGQNYWYDVGGDPPKAPSQPVIYRQGAKPYPEFVNVVRYSVTKKNVFPVGTMGAHPGTDLQTRLFLSAWARNVAYEKRLWIDVHVFDSNDALIHAETFPLHWAGSGSGPGDIFQFNGKIYQGSTATPGSVSPRPDARRMQCRLYYEVNNDVYSDSILYQQEMQEDALTR